METHLNKGIKKLAKSLDLEFSYSVAEHNFELGLPLENSLKTFFRKYFPERYAFGSGYLVDKDGKVSNQCDWIIYDAFNFAPLISKSNDSDNVEYFPYDSVYSIIEVKRTLNEKSLKRAIEQIKNTKILKRSKSSPGFINPLLNYTTMLTKDPSRIWTNSLNAGIYGFNTEMTIQDIVDILKTYDNLELMPNFIAVHGKYYICKSQNYSTPTKTNEFRLSFLPQQYNSYSCIESTDLTSGVFYVRLLNQLNNSMLSAKDYKDALNRLAENQTVSESFLFPNKMKIKYDKEV